MTWNEFQHKLLELLTDKSSGFCFTTEACEERERLQQTHVEHEAELKRQTAEKLATWFDRDEYTEGTLSHRLWLHLLYLWKDTKGECELPPHLINEIARCLLPDIIAYCESEEGKAAFAKWKEEQEGNNEEQQLGKQ